MGRPRKFLAIYKSMSGPTPQKDKNSHRNLSCHLIKVSKNGPCVDSERIGDLHNPALNRLIRQAFTNPDGFL